MARSNFSFKKRQTELERKKKQEDKQKRRLAKKAGDLEETPIDSDDEDLLPNKPKTSEDPEAAADEPVNR